MIWALREKLRFDKLNNIHTMIMLNLIITKKKYKNIINYII